jgi:hypothetical protein
MGTKRWRGDAPAVAQVATVTLTAYDATTTYIVTVNGKQVSVLGQGGTTATTATALQTALAASTIPEFLEVTWSVNSSTITGTAKTAGKPFTATSSVSGGAGMIGAFSTTTASSGPNDWSTAANWDTGAVPVAADDVYIENTSSAILYGLDQHTVTLNSLNIAATFTGTIGLPRINGSGSTAYFEYRPAYLQIGVTTCNIGTGSGSGSGRIKINFGAVQTAVNVYSTGSAAETGIPSLLLLGTHASNVVNCNKGSLGIAYFGGETSTVLTLDIGFVANQAGDSNVTTGAGTTLTTVNQYGGVWVNRATGGVTTFTQYAGTSTWLGGTWTTANLWGGKCFAATTGTFATSNVGKGATLDASQDMRAKTLTNCTLFAGATLNDPDGTLTFTNPFLLSGCGIADITVALGDNFHLQKS